jgi:IS30 family transposase
MAQRKCQNRRHLGHRRWRFSVADWVRILTRLQEGLSPEQIAGQLATERRLRISPETIYRFIWRNHGRAGISGGGCAAPPGRNGSATAATSAGGGSRGNAR